jgi:hypothetical protein
MTSDELLPADVTSCAAWVGAADDLRLLRRYEPVLRFTEGELFLPMPVEDYLERCSLWRTGSRRGWRRRGARERLSAPGELTSTRLAQMSDYRAHAEPASCPYYGRVSRDRGFIALQYWFFYAMNDWRSTFAGVNDHEADWEQVTIFLPDPPVSSLQPAWVAFSSHDETGDDLRRRFDDPDLHWRDTHPVVFVGAGSHSGACLPGDYLVTVEPPSLRRMLAGLRRLSRLLLPWTRTDSGTSFGLPFIDYHRGDGPGVGPGEAKRWCPVLIDDQTPWVRDYRGLWGLDTGDPFGGERAPAGPRYERDGAVRLWRVRRQALAEEREALARAVVHGLAQEDPHAHLRHRALPNVDPARTRTRVLRIWSGISASILLTGLALVILGNFGALLPAVGGLAVVMLCAEAFARGHLVRFIAGLIALAVAAAAAWLVTWAALGHWRSAIAILLLLAAAALLLVSIRDFFTKR